MLHDTGPWSDFRGSCRQTSVSRCPLLEYILLNRQCQVAFDLDKNKFDMYILRDKNSGWIL